MSASKIEWTDRVWNPVRGCSRVSEGCRNCYAERQAARFSGPGQYAEGFVRGGKWTGRVELVPDKLDEPLRWRKPARVFVNSMSDLFHESLPDEAIDRVFAVMARTPNHTFQVLTKRPERMREYLSDPLRAAALLRVIDNSLTRLEARRLDFNWPWPLPNVWLGVSVEDQETADARIPILLDTPAAVRFVSYEPALRLVDFRPEWMTKGRRRLHMRMDVAGALRNRSFNGLQLEDGTPLTRTRAELELKALRNAGVKFILVGGKCEGFSPHTGCPGHDLPRLDWLIVGGESGPGARVCDVAWIRSAIEQCKAAGVPVFVKQLGERPRLGDGAWHGKLPIFESHLAPRGQIVLRDAKGGDLSEWSEDLRVREFPA